MSEEGRRFGQVGPGGSPKEGPGATSTPTPPHVFRKLTHFSCVVYDEEDLFTIINMFNNPALDNEQRLLAL